MSGNKIFCFCFFYANFQLFLQMPKLICFVLLVGIGSMKIPWRHLFISRLPLEGTASIPNENTKVWCFKQHMTLTTKFFLFFAILLFIKQLSCKSAFLKQFEIKSSLTVCATHSNPVCDIIYEGHHYVNKELYYHRITAF